MFRRVLFRSFWKCKCCREKDEQVSNLQSEIAFLRKLVLPEYINNNSNIPIAHLESDAIMSGRDEQIQIASHEMVDQQETQREAVSILAGN